MSTHDAAAWTGIRRHDEYERRTGVRDRTVATYVDAETQVLSASNGVEYAYRATGASDATPLVMLQHFRGNLDNWDPALIDALARGRRVITFDNRGVAASSGTTPSTIAQMALDAIDSSMRWGSGRSICSGSRSAASWPRRSLSFALRPCARWCSPLRLRGERAECTAGPPTSSAPWASPRRRPRST